MSRVTPQSWAYSPCTSKIPSSPAGHAWRQHKRKMSIRKLFASDRGLFANGGKSIMMGTHCLHCQSQRRADGSQAQVDTRKHDSLETFLANACLTSDNWG